MRLPLIALIPAVLIAGGAYAQQETPPADPTPPEAVEAEEQTEQPAQQSQEPVEVETTEAAGAWTRTQTGGRETVAYTSTEGETLFSATCITADTEFGDRIIEIKAVSSGDTLGAIDIFTSAGNARIPAAPDTAPDTAAGLTEPVGHPTYVLAAGAGEMRIVSGSRGIVFETDPMLKEVLRGCRSEPRAMPAAPEEPEEDPAEDTETST